jgi:uncharacterized protein YdbL (DUF1318 family)
MSASSPGIRRRTAAISVAIGLAACAPTVNVATEKPIQIAVDVRIRLDDDVKQLLGAERSGVQARGLEVQPVSLEDSRAVASAKKARLVGERIDGYLAAVRAKPQPSLSALIERSNAARRTAYAALAAKNAVSTRAVEQVAGERRIEEAAPGEWVMRADGSWAPRE